MRRRLAAATVASLPLYGRTRRPPPTPTRAAAPPRQAGEPTPRSPPCGRISAQPPGTPRSTPGTASIGVPTASGALQLAAGQRLASSHAPGDDPGAPSSVPANAGEDAQPLVPLTIRARIEGVPVVGPDSGSGSENPASGSRAVPESTALVIRYKISGWSWAGVPNKRTRRRRRDHPRHCAHRTWPPRCGPERRRDGDDDAQRLRCQPPQHHRRFRRGRG